MKNSVRRRNRPLLAGLASLAVVLSAAAVPAEAAPPSKVDYVALGDSYTAGTGAGAFNPTGPCIQTPGGYVDIVGKTGRVNLPTDKACHGAFLALDPNSPVLHDPSIPNVEQQIASVAGSSLTNNTDLVTITAGANDVGVTGVLLTCLTRPAQDCTASIQASAALFPGMEANVVSVLQHIHAAAPNARITVLGYPRLFDPAIPFGQTDPALLSSIDAAVTELNSAISGAVTASGTGARFVDVTQRFAGHEVNSADPWIFFAAPALSPGGALVFDPRNFHPNASGYRAYASAVMGTISSAQAAAH